ncbi:MAG: methionyl-tRNA formyltransferase [Cyclobacteriaceae bacterium]|nr:methionyl-tRNA formyltransferase [Cyclobacteriaceae bacterium]MDW8332289.1 methionyl-tRNA formyltransferase [Cyclobacteriaceae bacterium]
MPPLRIVFMGTPEFAVPSLEILLAHHYHVAAVITAPDKPRGRGQEVTPSPVKKVAMQHHIPVLQPANLKSPEFLEELRRYNANLQVVVAFRMLPEPVWKMPELGTFNLHASLLPQYRGAAPINWAIINGEKETGVTTFFIQQEIDTGHIIFQESEIIYDSDDAGTLYERLRHKGARLVMKTVQAIESGNCPSHPQVVDGPLKTAPKIFRETCCINWKQPALSVHNFVRGLSPYPAAWTVWNNRTYKIFKTETVNQPADGEAGSYVTDNKNFLHVNTANGKISILELQPEGKRRMTIGEFFRGNKL